MGLVNGVCRVRIDQNHIFRTPHDNERRARRPKSSYEDSTGSISKRLTFEEEDVVSSLPNTYNRVKTHVVVKEGDITMKSHHARFSKRFLRLTDDALTWTDPPNRSALGCTVATETSENWTAKDEEGGGIDGRSKKLLLRKIETVATCYSFGKPERTILITAKGVRRPIFLRTSSASIAEEWTRAIRDALGQNDATTALETCLSLTRTRIGSPLRRRRPGKTGTSASLWGRVVGFAHHQHGANALRDEKGSIWDRILRLSRTRRDIRWSTAAARARSRAFRTNTPLASYVVRAVEVASDWRRRVATVLSVGSSAGARVVTLEGSRVWNFIGTTSVPGSVSLRAIATRDEDVRAIRWQNDQISRVRRDVARTFARASVDDRTRYERLLERVLLSTLPIMRLTADTERVGYCQGMNFVAGLTISTLCEHTAWASDQIEEITFWTLVRVYALDAPSSSSDTWTRTFVTHPRQTLERFDSAVRACVPNVYERMASLGLSVGILAPSVFGSLLIDVDSRLGLATLDMLLAGIRDAPVRMCIGLLEHVEARLLGTSDPAEFMSALREDIGDDAEVARVAFRAVEYDLWNTPAYT